MEINRKDFRKNLMELQNSLDYFESVSNEIRKADISEAVKVFNDFNRDRYFAFDNAINGIKKNLTGIENFVNVVPTL